MLLLFIVKVSSSCPLLLSRLSAHALTQWLLWLLGGKGRTGTMVCTWLLHSNAFPTADDALDYFASRRTDLSVGSKYQGVETPSQSRCTFYLLANSSLTPLSFPVPPLYQPQTNNKPTTPTNP